MTKRLFAFFLIIQLKYLFLHVEESDLKNLGINIATYSEYVRQGFFQLLIAATIAARSIISPSENAPGDNRVSLQSANIKPRAVSARRTVFTPLTERSTPEKGSARYRGGAKAVRNRSLKTKDMHKVCSIFN